MANPISPVLSIKLEEEVTGASTLPLTKPITGNIFEDVLNKAIEGLEGVSQFEFNANLLTDKYLKGEADITEVMIATSKLNIAVQLAVTTVTSAVNTFKEILQMPV